MAPELFSSHVVVMSWFVCCRQTAYKKHVEYLFWVRDPELTHGQNELLRTLEEGFMSANTYYVIVAVIYQWSLVASWGGWDGGKGSTCTFPSYSLLENFLPVEKCFPKNNRFVAESPSILGQFMGKIRILVTRTYLWCRKFEAVCWRIATLSSSSSSQLSSSQ